MPMDAKGAAKKARQYFEEVHGQFSVLGFQVEAANYDPRKGSWEVICAFHPLAGEKQALRYKVRVGNKSGDILHVEQMNGSSR